LGRLTFWTPGIAGYTGAVVMLLAGEMPAAAAVQQVSAADHCSESMACPDGHTTYANHVMAFTLNYLSL